MYLKCKKKSKNHKNKTKTIKIYPIFCNYKVLRKLLRILQNEKVIYTHYVMNTCISLKKIYIHALCNEQLRVSVVPSSEAIGPFHFSQIVGMRKELFL